MKFVATRPSVIAVLAAGYGDGVHRSLGTNGNVLVRGKQAPIVGIVSMDVTMIDVTDVSGVEIGDVVTIYGSDGETFVGDECGGAGDWDGDFGFDVRGDGESAAGVHGVGKGEVKKQ